MIATVTDLDRLRSYVDTTFIRKAKECRKEVVAGVNDPLKSFQQIHSQFIYPNRGSHPQYTYVARCLVMPIIERLPQRCAIANSRLLPVTMCDEIQLTKYGSLSKITDSINDTTEIRFSVGIKELVMPRVASFLPTLQEIESAMEPRMPRAVSQGTIDIVGIEQRRTEMAVLVRIMRIMGISYDVTLPMQWIPLSQIISREDRRDDTVFVVSAWLARKIIQEIRDDQRRGEIVPRVVTRPNPNAATIESIAEEYNLPRDLLPVLQIIESGAAISQRLPSEVLSRLHDWMNIVISRLAAPTYLDDQMILATLMRLRAQVQEMISRDLQASRQERELRTQQQVEQALQLMRDLPPTFAVPHPGRYTGADDLVPPVSPPVIHVGRMKRKFKLGEDL